MNFLSVSMPNATHNRTSQMSSVLCILGMGWNPDGKVALAPMYYSLTHLREQKRSL